MNKYIVITTLCNKEDIANKIIETLKETCSRKSII